MRSYGYPHGLKLLAIALVAVAGGPSTSEAQEADADAAALAKAAQNPLASVISTHSRFFETRG